MAKRHIYKHSFSCFLFFILISATATQADVMITSCGQIVENDHAILATDLDCTGNANNIAVSLTQASLDLNGFTLSRSDNFTDGTGFFRVGILCIDCAVNGPGQIIGFGAGLFGSEGRANLDQVTLTANKFGVHSNRKVFTHLIISNSQLDANEWGVQVDHARVHFSKSSASNNEKRGVSGGWRRFHAEDCQILNNGGRGLFAAEKMTVQSCSIQ